MYSKCINVHTFDGKLQGLFTPSKTYSLEEKKKSFTMLHQLITNNQNARDTINIMIESLYIEKNDNFQKENDMDSSDILMEIINCVENPDILSVLIEQLEDIKISGMCPSGRVTRLLQIWIAFI
jgi:hypothetical protein